MESREERGGQTHGEKAEDPPRPATSNELLSEFRSARTEMKMILHVPQVEERGYKEGEEEEEEAARCAARPRERRVGETVAKIKARTTSSHAL